MVDELHGCVPVARDTDFRPVYAGPDPLLTRVHACPTCGYAGYREAFEQAPSDEDELLEIVEDDPKALSQPIHGLPDGEDAADLRRWSKSGELTDGLVAPGREPFGAVRFLIAARVHEFLFEDDPLGAAHYHLRAAWCARGAGETALEQAALREVLIRLGAVLEGGATTESARVPLLYLAGEVARRTREFARAVDLFAQVEKEAEQDEEEGALLAALARRGAMFAHVQSAVNARIPPDLPARRGGGADDDGEGGDEELVFDDDEDDKETLN
jgi:hypothetical protein